MSSTSFKSAAVAAALVTIATTVAVTEAAAEPVTLRSRAAGFEIQGDLIGFDGKLLTVRSSMGVLKIPLAEVICTGAGCPEDAAATTPAATGAQLTLGPGFPGGLADALIGRFAEQPTVNVSEDGSRIETAQGEFALRSGGAGGSAPRLVFQPVSAGGRVLAHDPLVALAAPATRPRSLTLSALARIFTGEIINWSALGGRSVQVVPVLPADDPVVDALLAELTGGRTLAGSIQRVDDVTGFLLGNAGAIALVRGSTRGALRATPLAGDCGLTIQPSNFSVSTGQYPLSAILTVAGNPSDPALAEFVEFIGSEDGQSVLTAEGLVGRNLSRADPAWQEDWIASAAKLAEFEPDPGARENMRALSEASTGATRLSLTLRYPFTNDAPATDDFRRLAAAIESGEFDGGTIVFAGFVDPSTGRGGADRRSSDAAERALADFLDAQPGLRDRAGVGYRAEGFGAVAPLQCSETELERRANDRVEVWFKPE